MRLSDLNGKSVVILGSGREGGAAVRALKKMNVNAHIRVLDENAKEGAALEGLPIEPFDVNVLDDADVIVRSPGISIYKPEFQNRPNMTTATNLWFAEPHSPVIAFTGTKGKSTSSSLTAHLLRSIGFDARLAGNIGQSPLDLIGEPEPDWWVLELSSFQTSDLQGKPLVAAITSFSPEHLDWHRNAENYENDKTRLLELAQKRVVNPIDEVTRSLLERFPDATHPPLDTSVPPSNLQGRHNAQLIRLVLEVLRVAGIDTIKEAAKIEEGLRTFQPLPHRLEPVAQVDEVLYINDSLSTTPIATQAAIAAFEDRPRTVLVGGYDRGVSYDELGTYLRAQDVNDANAIKIITLPDSGDRIAKAIDMPSIITHANDLKHAVEIAALTTPPGGVVLLSPGAASFGHFVDYADRGAQFARLVAELAGSKQG